MQISYGYKAARQLTGLPSQTRERIARKMKFFGVQENPLLFAKKLIDREGYRFRVGDYRILFKVENLNIAVISIEKRDEAYD